MLRFDINALFTAINILILYFLMRRFLFKPVHKILDARQAEIDKQYADAKMAQEKAQELKAQYESSMEVLAQKKTEVMSEAMGKASVEYEKIVDAAKEEVDKLLREAEVRAKQEGEKQVQRAREQIADLVVDAVAKIAVSKVSAEGDKALYNEFIAKTGERID